MKRTNRLTIGAITAVAALALSSCGTDSAGDNGEEFPSGQVRIILPYSAGGVSDGMIRILQSSISEELGADVIIENKAGASGATAHMEVAEGDPDGHTALLTTTSLITSVPLLQDVPYDPDNDFRSIGGIADQAYILTVAEDSPYETLEDLESATDSLTYSTPSAGTLPHRLSAVFADEAGVDAAAVPYESAAEAMTALLGGEVDFYLAEITLVVPQLEAGDVRALAISYTDRHPAVEEVPTFAEQGYENIVETASYGLIAHSDTSDESVEAWQNALETALASDEWSEYAENNQMIEPEAAPSEWLDNELSQTSRIEDQLDSLNLLD